MSLYPRDVDYRSVQQEQKYSTKQLIPSFHHSIQTGIRERKRIALIEQKEDLKILFIFIAATTRKLTHRSHFHASPIPQLTSIPPYSPTTCPSTFPPSASTPPLYLNLFNPLTPTSILNTLPANSSTPLPSGPLVPPALVMMRSVPQKQGHVGWLVGSLISPTISPSGESFKTWLPP